MGQHRQLRAADGFAFDIYEALPDGVAAAGVTGADRPALKGSVVIIQEIFGVNAHIREVTDGFAKDGYAALAPAIFDRAERGVELGYDGDGMARGRDLAFSGISREEALRDIQATVEEAGKYGPVGVVGYCYGGLLTWLSACELTGVACASAYYGGGIAGTLVREDGNSRLPKCPFIMHFGALDAHIPMTDVDKIKAALPDVPVHVYDADHGFNCDHRGSHHAASAATARERTLGLFEAHLAGE